jgi:sterol desaturase/sphingolipid hydroxylase (fatty acid hydroxylase superfamily)
MSHLPTDHSDIPIRLFKSDFLEFFTHISPVAVVVIWLPVAIFFLVRSLVRASTASFPAYIPLGFLIGLILWTLSEYLLHRFVFHFPAKSVRAERITFLFHGIHHAQPQIKTRLVMPPVVSIPLAAAFYGLFYLILSVVLKLPQWVDPMFSAFIFGYLVYDLTHYATHHFPMRSGYAKFVKLYHMQHHYKTPDQRFGVSSPLWDVVFHTMPE